MTVLKKRCPFVRQCHPYKAKVGISRGGASDQSEVERVERERVR